LFGELLSVGRGLRGVHELGQGCAAGVPRSCPRGVGARSARTRVVKRTVGRSAVSGELIVMHFHTPTGLADGLGPESGPGSTDPCAPAADLSAAVVPPFPAVWRRLGYTS